MANTVACASKSDPPCEGECIMDLGTWRCTRHRLSWARGMADVFTAKFLINLIVEQHASPDTIVFLLQNLAFRQRIPCPVCGKLHIDEGEFAWKLHHTHSCQFCGNTWRPAVEYTVGVQFLPGFKNDGN